MFNRIGGIRSAGVLAKALRTAVVAGLLGLLMAPAVEADQATFRVIVHIRYLDGWEWEGIVAQDVPPEEVAWRIADCNRSHRGGSGVWFHCYAVPE